MLQTSCPGKRADRPRQSGPRPGGHSAQTVGSILRDARKEYPYSLTWGPLPQAPACLPLSSPFLQTHITSRPTGWTWGSLMRDSLLVPFSPQAQHLPGPQSRRQTPFPHRPTVKYTSQGSFGGMSVGAIPISQGCANKCPQPQWLTATDTDCLPVLEARRSRSASALRSKGSARQCPLWRLYRRTVSCFSPLPVAGSFLGLRLRPYELQGQHIKSLSSVFTSPDPPSQ